LSFSWCLAEEDVFIDRTNQIQPTVSSTKLEKSPQVIQHMENGSPLDDLDTYPAHPNGDFQQQSIELPTGTHLLCLGLRSPDSC
jgi:hypothetical protein